MGWNPKLRINLLDIFNRNYSDKPYEVRRALRDVIRKSSFKDDFGLKAIDVITERTLSGKDRFGDTFTKYSKAYKNSTIFDIYGKTSKVNLELTGEMLASMEVRSSGDEITIKFVDSLNAAKAHGHITGMNGRKGGVVRDFFGLSKTEEDKVMKELINEYSSSDPVLSEARALIRELGNG